MFSRALLAALLVAAASEAAAFAPGLPSASLMQLSAKSALPLSKARSTSTTAISMSDVSRRSALAGLAGAAFTLANPLRGEADVGGFKTSDFIPTGAETFSIPVPEGYTGPLPKASTAPEEAIATILKAMQTNDKPSENYGLKTAIAFTSSANPFAKMPISKFRSIMDGSSYKVLFGGYDRFENVVIKGDDPNEIVVDSKLFASADKLKQTISKDKYINTKGPEPYAVMRWKLSKGEGTGNAWLFDTVYFLNQIDPNGF